MVRIDRAKPSEFLERVVLAHPWDGSYASFVNVSPDVLQSRDYQKDDLRNGSRPFYDPALEAMVLMSGRFEVSEERDSQSTWNINALAKRLAVPIGGLYFLLDDSARCVSAPAELTLITGVASVEHDPIWSYEPIDRMHELVKHGCAGGFTYSFSYGTIGLTFVPRDGKEHLSVGNFRIDNHMNSSDREKQSAAFFERFNLQTGDPWAPYEYD